MHDKNSHHIDLKDYDNFISHPWVQNRIQKYKRDSILAHHAVLRFIRDLKSINDEYYKEHKRVLCTTIDGRVKKEKSFFNKLHEHCLEKGKKDGLSQKKVNLYYSAIKDLGGVRFSCPYYDEVKPAINNYIRPKLKMLGYGIDPPGRGTKDKDYLDKGDSKGYRSYHFFVKVPTITDIFGKAELFLCEVQGRSELQHIWAVKSHDLLYKPKGDGWHFGDKHVIDDMKHLSNSLRTADQSLMSIRDRIRK